MPAIGDGVPCDALDLGGGAPFGARAGPVGGRVERDHPMGSHGRVEGWAMGMEEDREATTRHIVVPPASPADAYIIIDIIKV